MKSTPKVAKKALRSYHMRQLRNYKHELILWTKDRPIKKVFQFMVESNDRRLFWKSVFVAATASAPADLPIEQRGSVPTQPSALPPSSNSEARISSRPPSSYVSEALATDSIPGVPATNTQNPLANQHNASTTSVTFSSLPSSDSLQPSLASAYMATRFSSLSEHMAYALKSVGEEERKASKKKRTKDDQPNSSRDGSEGQDIVPGAPQVADSRPRFSILTKDTSVFRTLRTLFPPKQGVHF